jgi:Flp pilus assembly protein CpaB
MKQKQLLTVFGLAVAAGVAVWYFQRQRVKREQGGTVTEGANSTLKSASTATVVPQAQEFNYGATYKIGP